MMFSDGMEFDTSGPLRAVEEVDGWYVVGNGLLYPVRDREEADRIIGDLGRLGWKPTEQAP